MRCGGNICHVLFLYIIWSTPLTHKVRRSIYQHNVNIKNKLYDQHLPKEKDPKVILLQIHFYNSDISKASSSALEQCRDRGVWIQNWAEGLHHPPLICCFWETSTFEKGVWVKKSPQNVNIIEVSEKDVHSVGSIHVPASGKWSLMEVPSRVVKQRHGRNDVERRLHFLWCQSPKHNDIDLRANLTLKEIPKTDGCEHGHPWAWF